MIAWSSTVVCFSIVEFPCRYSNVFHLGSLVCFFRLLFLCGVRLEQLSRVHLQSCQVGNQLAGGLTGLLGLVFKYPTADPHED